MSFRRILAITLLLTVVGLVLIVGGLIWEWKLAIPLGFDALLVATAWLTFHLLRGIARRLLFRVGNRLFVSYLLIGAVPIVLVFCLVLALVYLLTGQLAVRRVEQELDAALVNLRTTATVMSAELELGSDAAARREIFRQHIRPEPGIGWALRPLQGGLDGEGPLDPALLLPEGRIQTSLEAVGRLGPEHQFLAVVAPPGPAGSLIVYQRIEPDLRQAIEEKTKVYLRFSRPGEAGENGEEGQVGISVASRRLRFSPFGPAADEADADQGPEPVEAAGIFGQPWVFFVRSVELPYVNWMDEDWHAAIEGGNETYGLIARTSIAREYLELFHSATADDLNQVIGKGAIRIPLLLSVSTLVIYLLAVIIASILVYRIARATSRLHRGFAEVEKGNYDVRLSLRGHDQLTDLVESFNRMASHLGKAIDEGAEREAIGRELEIARQLQRSLLPPADFCAPGFEIAADFQPAAAIGGDFYHFTRRADGRLLVGIADVSGHGLSTGIVMSAAKALLSALSTDECPSPELLERLDCELRSHTGRRHFVTLGLCNFDLARGRMELTNAGHLYPYRLRPDGQLTAIENPSRPLAVALPQDFRSVAADIAPGDLWILYSDGVIEAQSPQGEVFGFERFEKLLRGCAGKSAVATRDTVLSAWRDFVTCECPEDDRTLLVLKILP